MLTTHKVWGDMFGESRRVDRRKGTLRRCQAENSGESIWIHLKATAKFEDGHGASDGVEVERSEEAFSLRRGDAQERQGGGNGLIKDACGADEDNVDMLRQIRWVLW